MTRYSADLKDVLLPMMLDRGPEGEKLRYRYFRIIADFMSRNYFRQIREYVPRKSSNRADICSSKRR